MPPEPLQTPILTVAEAELAPRLWQALAPQRWPLDPALLPAGTLLVGGAVRDALLGRLGQRPDLDFVLEGDAVALARQLAQRCGASFVLLDGERSIARLVLRGWNLDLARRMGADPLDDLRRRDYSVNAIALPLDRASGPLDPCHGLSDLRAGLLRAISADNLRDDPLRLLRGPRLACELGLRLEARSLSWIAALAPLLTTVAGERVLAELERLAQAERGEQGLQQTLELGLLGGWQADGAEALPRLALLSRDRANRNGLRPEEQAWALPLARLAALLPPGALNQLRASRRLQQRCQRLRQWLQRLGAPPDAAGVPADRPRQSLDRLPEEERLALQRELEEDLPALALHLPAEEAQEVLRRWRDPEDPLFHPRPPLDGLTLQRQLGLEPGRQLGQLLAHLSRERAFGRLAAQGDQTEALQRAQAWLAICDGSGAAASGEGPAA